MELFDRFLQERTYLKGVSPDTLDYYKCVCRAFGEILAQPTKEGMMDCIQNLLAKGVSPISVNTHLRRFRVYINWLHQEGHLTQVFKVQMLKAEQKVIQTLAPEHVQRILRLSPQDAKDRRVHTFICLCLDTGLRLSEALALTKDSVDLDNLVLKVRGEGSKHRLVPFSIECRKILYRYIAKENTHYVFATRSGTPITTRNLGRDIAHKNPSGNPGVFCCIAQPSTAR